MNSLSDAREFCDPETASSSGASHVPSQPLTFPSPRTVPCRDSGLPHDTRNIRVLQETFLNDHLLQKDALLLSSTIPRIWQPLLKNWDLILNEIQRGPRVKWDENRNIRRYLYDASKVKVDCWNTLVELILTMVWRITRDFPSRKCMHLGKCPDSMEILSWTLNFKTEVCSITAHPHLTMHWTKEVEMAKSIDELVTSRSILERTDFPTTTCLMRWLRPPWRCFSTSMFASAKE